MIGAATATRAPLLQRFGLGCLALLGSLAACPQMSFGQYGPPGGGYPPGPSPYGHASYQQPGPYAGYGVDQVAYQQQMALSPPSGVEMGGMQSMGHGMSLGDYGHVQMQACPDPSNPGGGMHYNGLGLADWLTNAQFGVYTNENQTLYTGGTTLAFVRRDDRAVGGRLLFGYADDDILGETTTHFTGEGYVSQQFGFVGGEHWIKVGGFYDAQDDFAKFGPEFGLLAFANCNHPITLDVALGFGEGDEIFLPAQGIAMDVADEDFQVRLGTYISERFQVGIAFQHIDFDNTAYDPEDPDRVFELGFAGFCNVQFRNVAMNLELGSDENDDFRGFLNLSYNLGPRRLGERWSPMFPLNKAHPVNPQVWAMQPVQRDPSLVIRSRSTTGGGGGTTPTGLIVTCEIIQPVRIGPGVDDGDGVVEAGEGFEVEVTVTNASGATVTGVAIVGPATVTGPAAAGNTFGTAAVDLAAGASTTTDSNSDADLVVNAGAINGASININFSITANGTTIPITCGPVVVGTTTAGTIITVTP
jgi:hypothetical protein